MKHLLLSAKAAANRTPVIYLTETSCGPFSGPLWCAHLLEKAQESEACMARTPSETRTGREAEVMDASWRLGELTAEQVRGALPEPLHDSTVRTLLRVLESKGYLRHEVRGKAFVYR